MIIRAIFILVFSICSCANSFAQRISKDADNNLWLITDSIKGITYYKDNRGKCTEVLSMNNLVSNKEEIDSLIMNNQYNLWEKKYGFKCFEPYASVIYSILFSKKMKMLEVRILKREAYEKNPIIDNIIIASIKGTKKMWRKNNKHVKNKKNIIYASRIRVAIPIDTN